MVRLRLRWALRDARAQWVPVVAIALMIAIGTGLYAGLSSLTEWRIASNEASLDVARMHDLRGSLGGGYLPQGALAGAAAQVDGVAYVEERLVVPTQADVAVPGGESVFVPARIVGVDLSGDGPDVDRVIAYAGGALSAADAGEPVVALERNFAVFHELAETGDLTLAGGASARYVGHAVSPEYYVIIEDGNFLGQANLAVLFTSIETAQELAGRPEQVNDVVLILEEGADAGAVEDALAAAVEERHPGSGLQFTRKENDPSYLALTNDPEGDQQFYNVFAVLLFAGAAFAALNLVTRMVEARRREIGVLMALGVRPLSIAARPVLVGVQIGALGVVFGVGVGLLVGNAMGGVIEDFVPLPVFETPFQTGLFARAAAIGFLVPVLAAVWPVHRAVRVAPVEAIRTGHLAARGGGLAPLASRIPLPGGSFARMPLRNLLRAPRRTLLTALALTAVLAMMLTFVVMVNSFLVALDDGDEELLGDAPDRLIVDLDGYYPAGAPEVAAVAGSALLESAEPEVATRAAIPRDGDPLHLLLRFVDFESDLWRPSVVDGALDVDRPGVVLARKAAEDLRVGPGDSVEALLPVRTGEDAFAVATVALEVLAVHPHPLRNFAYADIRHAGIAGLEGYANSVSAVPAAGETLRSVKRGLFTAPGVSAVTGLSETSQATSDAFEQFTSVFLVIQAFIVGLAVLMAFNTANINAEERARDHATMFAYGVPLRRVLAVFVAEGLLLGAFAALLAVPLGVGIVLWVLRFLLPESAPDIYVPLAVDAGAVAVALALAVAAIGAAPLLTVRKLRGMNVPATLRVLE